MRGRMILVLAGRMTLVWMGPSCDVVERHLVLLATAAAQRVVGTGLKGAENTSSPMERAKNESLLNPIMSALGR
jgi:hypothetical protein